VRGRREEQRKRVKEKEWERERVQRTTSEGAGGMDSERRKETKETNVV
jgi:hypothetical protein